MASTTIEKPIILHDAADSLRVSVVFVLALTGIQRGIGFVRKCLFCAWMAPDELGQWDLAFGFISLAAAVAVMGLPGSLLRFVEYFRKRGQLRTYLWWTMLATGLLAGVFTGGLLLFRSDFARVTFGGREFQHLVPPIAIALLMTVAFNAVSTFFTAMRLQRIRSLLATAYGISFTMLGSALLLFWQPTATIVILAHCLSLLACLSVGVYWIRTSRHLLPPDSSTSGIGAGFCSQVVPFAMAVWMTNALANLFPLVDRYMIVTVWRQDPETALGFVGQYHVARLIPVFMLSLAQVLHATLMPYLSHDWESGDRRKVGQRLDSFLRLFGLGFFATAVIFLAFGPWLLAFLFGDKFQAGVEVLSLTLSYGVFASLFVLAQSYLWCLQKGWLVNAGLVGALVMGVGLNLLLLPRFGLSGAAMASCIAMIILLVYVIICSRAVGMRFQAPTGVVILLPLALLLGPQVGLITLLSAVVVTVNSDLLLTKADKQQAAELAKRFGDRLRKKSRGLMTKD